MHKPALLFAVTASGAVRIFADIWPKEVDQETADDYNSYQPQHVETPSFMVLRYTLGVAL